MKKLKFLILPLIFLGLFSISCNNDDDAPANVDVIVGTWKINDIIVDGQSILPIIVLADPCFLDSKFIFQNDYSCKFEINQKDQTTGNCVISETQNGNWSKEGSTYFISVEGQTQNSEVTFADDDNFQFTSEYDGQTAIIKLKRVN